MSYDSELENQRKRIIELETKVQRLINQFDRFKQKQMVTG